MILAEAGYASFATKALAHSAQYATRNVPKAAGWAAKNAWPAIKDAGKEAAKKAKRLDDLLEGGEWITSFNSVAKLKPPKVEIYDDLVVDLVYIPLTAK